MVFLLQWWKLWLQRVLGIGFEGWMVQGVSPAGFRVAKMALGHMNTIIPCPVPGEMEVKEKIRSAGSWVKAVRKGTGASFSHYSLF